MVRGDYEGMVPLFWLHRLSSVIFIVFALLVAWHRFTCRHSVTTGYLYKGWKSLNVV